MGKPIVNKVSTFDASDGYTFSFTYSGNQPYQNRILILSTETNNTVLDETIDSMKFIHEIASDILTNGVSYSVQFMVYDNDGNTSSLSDKVYFTCYSTPTFIFTDLSTENQNSISSSSYTASITYSQNESRLLKEYKFLLYSASKTLLKDSGITIYSSLDSVNYLFKTFENDTIYYIRCIGVTVDDVNLDTGYVKIFASYSVQNSYSNFYLSCNKRGGYIQGNTNITSINGVAIGTYSISDGKLYLQNGAVNYSESIMVSGNQEIALTISDINDNCLIWKSSNGIDTIEIDNFIYESQSYIRLKVSNVFTNYILYSDLMTLTSSQEITIYVKRIDNLYDLTVITE